MPSIRDDGGRSGGVEMTVPCRPTSMSTTTSSRVCGGGSGAELLAGEAAPVATASITSQSPYFEARERYLRAIQGGQGGREGRVGGGTTSATISASRPKRSGAAALSDEGALVRSGARTAASPRKQPPPPTKKTANEEDEEVAVSPSASMNAAASGITKDDDSSATINATATKTAKAPPDAKWGRRIRKWMTGRAASTSKASKTSTVSPKARFSRSGGGGGGRGAEPRAVAAVAAPTLPSKAFLVQAPDSLAITQGPTPEPMKTPSSSRGTQDLVRSPTTVEDTPLSPAEPSTTDVTALETTATTTPPRPVHTTMKTPSSAMMARISSSSLASAWTVDSSASSVHSRAASLAYSSDLASPDWDRLLHPSATAAGANNTQRRTPPPPPMTPTISTTSPGISSPLPPLSPPPGLLLIPHPPPALSSRGGRDWTPASSASSLSTAGTRSSWHGSLSYTPSTLHDSDGSDLDESWHSPFDASPFASSPTPDEHGDKENDQETMGSSVSLRRPPPGQSVLGALMGVPSSTEHPRSQKMKVTRARPPRSLTSVSPLYSSPPPSPVSRLDAFGPAAAAAASATVPDHRRPGPDLGETGRPTSSTSSTSSSVMPLSFSSASTVSTAERSTVPWTLPPPRTLDGDTVLTSCLTNQHRLSSAGTVGEDHQKVRRTVHDRTYDSVAPTTLDRIVCWGGTAEEDHDPAYEEVGFEGSRDDPPESLDAPAPPAHCWGLRTSRRAAVVVRGEGGGPPGPSGTPIEIREIARSRFPPSSTTATNSSRRRLRRRSSSLTSKWG